MKTSNYADNILNRHFDEYGPGYVLGNRHHLSVLWSSKDSKAYLSVVKGWLYKADTLHMYYQTSLEEDFRTENNKSTVIEKHKHDIHTDALIHSDQGAHYTSIRFIDLT